MTQPEVKRTETIQTARGTATAYYVSNMPASVHGAVGRDNAGITIMINAALPEQQQQEALRHELKHIELGHTDSDCRKTAAECEEEVRQERGKQ